MFIFRLIDSMNNILKGELSMINIKYNDSYEIISQGIIDLGVLGKYTAFLNI